MSAGTGPLRAIETSYAGCRFRSRLEARWAVFFDALGITWQYEPQGYDIPRAGWYLPDFWLPAQELWIEVKGVLSSRAELEKLIYASRYLPGAIAGTYPAEGYSDGPVTGGGLVVLGQVPLVRQGWLAWHRGYRFQEEGSGHCPPGHYWTATWFFQRGKLNLFQPEGIDLGTDGALSLSLNSPSVSKFDAHTDSDECWDRWGLGADAAAAQAYQDARSARFEHGESGVSVQPRAAGREPGRERWQFGGPERWTR